MKKQIAIRIFPDGRVETVTHNIKGKACLEHFKMLENMLQARAVDSDFTSEYYEQEQEQAGEVAQHINQAE